MANILEKADRFEDVINRRRPEIMDELRGMSDGAKISYEDLMAATLDITADRKSYAPISDLFYNRGFAGERTSYATAGSATSDGLPITAKNADHPSPFSVRAAQKIRKVSVIGLGMLGTQIAAQASCYGYDVKAYDQDPGSYQRTIQRLRPTLTPTVSIEEWENGIQKVKHCRDLSEALQDADLAIEVIYEDLELKRKIFAQMDTLTPKEAILATNSSSIAISKIESATKRSEKCVNMHFYFPAGAGGYPVNIVDIMGGTKTTVETIETCQQWVRSVGCIPLTVKKELLGFCFNSVWRAVKHRTLHMWAEGYVDFRDIDRAWMVFTRMPMGPFGLMDMVGLDVVYGIEMTYYNESGDQKDHPPQALKNMVDRKELGMKTGKGFYIYPNPEYRRSDFLRG